MRQIISSILFLALLGFLIHGCDTVADNEAKGPEISSDVYDETPLPDPPYDDPWDDDDWDNHDDDDEHDTGGGGSTSNPPENTVPPLPVPEISMGGFSFTSQTPEYATAYTSARFYNDKEIALQYEDVRLEVRNWIERRERHNEVSLNAPLSISIRGDETNFVILDERLEVAPGFKFEQEVSFDCYSMGYATGLSKGFYFTHQATASNKALENGQYKESSNDYDYSYTNVKECGHY